MKRTAALAATLLLVSASALSQIGPKPSSCRASFGFMYTDKLGNKYDTVQGKELREIQRRLSKKQHGSVCITDEGVPDFILNVSAQQKSRLWNGNEIFYTNYVLEVHSGKEPFDLLHTFAVASRRKTDSAPIVDLVEEAAEWLHAYLDRHQEASEEPAGIIQQGRRVLGSGAAQAEDNHVQAATVCDKLPYRLGHIVILNSTDLRSYPRRITEKESEELDRRQSELQAKCNAFVRKSPGQPVSTEFSYEVRGFAAYYVRCESFCGTEDDLLRLGQKEIDEMMAPHK